MEGAWLELVAIQPYVRPEDYFDEAAFWQKMHGLLARADALRARDTQGRRLHPALAVLPEEIGTFLPLMGHGPRLAGCRTTDQAMTRVGLSCLPGIAGAMLRHRTLHFNRAFFLALAPRLHAVYHRTFSALAREFELTLVAGSLLLPANRLGPDAERFEPAGPEFYNTSYTFDPTGRCLSATRKVNLVPGLETDLGITPGRIADLAAVDSPAGRVGTMICYDGFRIPHTHGEPGFTPLLDVFDAQGATILAQPAANPWPWEAPWVFNDPGEALLRKDQWMLEGLASQLGRATHVRYAVNPQLLGQIYDHPFDGRSLILAREGTEVRVLAAAARADNHPDAEEVLLARVPHPSITAPLPLGEGGI